MLANIECRALPQAKALRPGLDFDPVPALLVENRAIQIKQGRHGGIILHGVYHLLIRLGMPEPSWMGVAEELSNMNCVAGGICQPARKLLSAEAVRL